MTNSSQNYTCECTHIPEVVDKQYSNTRHAYLGWQHEKHLAKLELVNLIFLSFILGQSNSSSAVVKTSQGSACSNY